MEFLGSEGNRTGGFLPVSKLKIESPERALIWALVRHKSRNGGCWASPGELGKTLGLTRQTVREHLKGLILQGHLAKSENGHLVPTVSSLLERKSPKHAAFCKVPWYLLGLPFTATAKVLAGKVLAVRRRKGKYLPSLKNFAEDLDLHIATIKRALAQLKEAGLVGMAWVPAKGHYRKRYWLRSGMDKFATTTLTPESQVDKFATTTLTVDKSAPTILTPPADPAQVDKSATPRGKICAPYPEPIPEYKYKAASSTVPGTETGGGNHPPKAGVAAAAFAKGEILSERWRSSLPEKPLLAITATLETLGVANAGEVAIKAGNLGWNPGQVLRKASLALQKNNPAGYMVQALQGEPNGEPLAYGPTLQEKALEFEKTRETRAAENAQAEEMRHQWEADQACLKRKCLELWERIQGEPMPSKETMAESGKFGTGTMQQHWQIKQARESWRLLKIGHLERIRTWEPLLELLELADLKRPQRNLPHHPPLNAPLSCGMLTFKYRFSPGRKKGVVRLPPIRPLRASSMGAVGLAVPSW